MNDNITRRLLGLVEKTGDKVIVTDPAGEHPYVLMSLDQYERLVGAPPAAQSPAETHISAPIIAEKIVSPIQAPKKAVPNPANPSAWRSKLGLDAVEPPVQELFKSSVRPKTPIQAEEAKFEAEGEEQFYLEPLE